MYTHILTPSREYSNTFSESFGEQIAQRGWDQTEYACQACYILLPNMVRGNVGKGHDKPTRFGPDLEATLLLMDKPCHLGHVRGNK
jgi:hypothetical protein